MAPGRKRSPKNVQKPRLEVAEDTPRKNTTKLALSSNNMP